MKSLSKFMLPALLFMAVVLPSFVLAASPSISLDNIPSSIRKPGKYFEFNSKLAVNTLPANLQKVLIIAGKTSAGSVAQKIPTRVYSESDAKAFFGSGSQAHLMAKAAIQAYPYINLTVVGLDDAGGGVAATGKYRFTARPTSSGSVTLWIGNQTVTVAVDSTNFIATMASALNTQIGKQPNLPITAAFDAHSTITLTAKCKGTQGNNIPLTYETTATAVAATVTAMASGATDPEPNDALTAVQGEQYNIIAFPWNDSTNIAKLKTHLDFVSGPLEQRPSVAFYGNTGTLNTATVLSALVNHPRITGVLLRNTKSQPVELAAAFAAVRASEEDPARPLNTLQLIGINAPAVQDRLTRTEQETCLNSGITPIEVGPGDRVQVVRWITTYTVDAQSIPDIAFLDGTTISTLDYVRDAIRQRLSLRFPREKLSQKTPPRVRAEIIDVLKRLESLEIIENVDANLDGVVVERDSQDPNRLDAKIPADVVNGLHVIAGRIDLIL